MAAVKPDSQAAAAAAMWDWIPASPAEWRSIRRIRCPPGSLCRTACRQASDHLGLPPNFRGTIEPALGNCPQPVSPPVGVTLAARRAHAKTNDSTDMKATAGAREVNMADENSLRVGFAARSYFIAPAR